MQLELIFGNERRFLGGIRAFVRETLGEFELAPEVAARLGEVVIAAAESAIDHAYPMDEEGSIGLTIHEQHGKLEFLVRDYGLPEDVAELERRLREPGTGARARDWPGAEVVDEMHWIAHGREGKAIQIVKWLNSKHVAESGSAASLDAFRDDAALAPEQEYTIRRMAPDEATQVSQLIYRAYGNSYFNEDVYYPDRIAAHNASGSVLSFVAAGADGKLVGHYALERNQEGPVAEGGQAVVDPAHRGRGLMERMKDAALDEARRLQLNGWYADAVTVHTMTQKSNLKHGARPACVDLAISPKTENFRNISTQLKQRVTCLLYFHWLSTARERTIHVPARHRGIVSAIYENLGCPITFGELDEATGHGKLKVSIDSGAATATIRVEETGADSLQLIRHAKRDVLEHSHVEVVYCELALADNATSVVAEALEAEGFGFLGVAPHFSSRGDLLRMAYLIEPLAREAIQTVDEFAEQLVDYALAEQSRVTAGL